MSVETRITRRRMLATVYGLSFTLAGITRTHGLAQEPQNRPGANPDLRSPAPNDPATSTGSPIPAGDPALLSLKMTPELETIAPFQPLYVKLQIFNRSKQTQPFPRQVRVQGIRFTVREEGFRAKVIDRPRELFGDTTAIQGQGVVTEFRVLAEDHLPADFRRSPRRIFDLPGYYDVRALSGDINLLEYTDLKSDDVRIHVRKPSEDETIASEILKGVKHGPPFHFTGSQDPELVKQLREFLAKYPKSAFADEFKLLLGWRLLELAIKRTETERIVNPELQAEAIKIWMTVDVKRTWVRRTVITEELMTYLCKPEIQKHLKVQEVLTQWKNYPPHDADDAEKAVILKEWVPKIEASLRENQGPKTL